MFQVMTVAGVTGQLGLAAVQTVINTVGVSAPAQLRVQEVDTARDRISRPEIAPMVSVKVIKPFFIMLGELRKIM